MFTFTGSKRKILLVSASLFLLVSLCAHPVTPQGSYTAQEIKQAKESILNSIVFRTADVFYPKDELQPDLKLSQLTPKQVDDFTADLNRVTAKAIEIYNQNSFQIKEYMEAPLPPSLAATIELVPVDGPVIQSQPNEDSPGKHVLHIEVSLKALQDNLRAGVAATFRGHEDLNPLKESDAALFKIGGRVTPLSDEEILAKFLVYKHNVTAALSRDPTPLQLVFIGTSVTTVDSRCTGVLLFAIAHELGHFALNHFHPSDYPVCKVFKQEELDADRFASYLLTRVLLSRGVFGAQFMNEFTGFLYYGGSDVFFEEGYQRYGIKDDAAGQSDKVCHYPPVNERLKTANTGISDAVADSQSAEERRSAKGLDDLIQEIQNKNLKKKKP
jgi:hypothetical protein